MWTAPAATAVSSHDEWSLLEEVIVGRVDGAVVPDEPPAMIQATMPKNQWQFFRDNAGKPFPPHQVQAAARELDHLVHVFQGEGVRVRRPEDPKALFRSPILTDRWQTQGGMYVAMPRDNLLVVGQRIIEAPMAWRSRRREGQPYEALMREYRARGATWIKAAAPVLADDFYTRDWVSSHDEFCSVIGESEPTFDAADFMRFGKDIVCQQSHVTNRSGIDWVRRTLGDDYRVHTVRFVDAHPMHIDATIMPLRPGLLLINPERVPPKLADTLRKTLFQGWDLVEAPRPVMPDSHCLYMTSKWISMNVISIDERRVLIEAQDDPMLRLMRSLGLMPIPVPFRHFNSFGGSFHCATCDVKRAGAPRSWLTPAGVGRQPTHRELEPQA